MSEQERVDGIFMKYLVQILLSVVLNSAAQLLMKKGMLEFGGVDTLGDIFPSLPQLITNIYLWGSAACYIASIFLWMVVLSKVEVSYAYPFLSLGYVIVALMGYFCFGESLSVGRIMGVFVICAGVFLISGS